MPDPTQSSAPANLPIDQRQPNPTAGQAPVKEPETLQQTGPISQASPSQSEDKPPLKQKPSPGRIVLFSHPAAGVRNVPAMVIRETEPGHATVQAFGDGINEPISQVHLAVKVFDTEADVPKDHAGGKFLVWPPRV